MKVVVEMVILRTDEVFTFQCASKREASEEIEILESHGCALRSLQVVKAA